MVRAAILTVVIETAFFFIIGYRGKLFFLYWALVNLFTNIALNLSLRVMLVAGMSLPAVKISVYPLELAVVLIEWLFLSVFHGKKLKLLFHVFLSNLISYSAGLLIDLLIR